MVGEERTGGNAVARAQRDLRVSGQKGQLPDGAQVPCFERQFRRVGVANWLQSFDYLHVITFCTSSPH